MTRICFCSVALGLLLFANNAQAQSYKTAAGIRVDKGFNITVQQHIVNNWTAEGIVHTSVGSDNLGLTLLAEKHQKILFRGLNLYYGAGGHYYAQNDPTQTETTVKNHVYGLSMIGGAEVSLGRINLALDWKPELHFSESSQPFNWNGASLSVRYIFAKREKKRIRDWKIFGGGKKKKK
ncbi:MAG: hypothetical protein H6574_07995 [Lewinellaceae bacterium]|nr:hypothetical protein [Saprospiraceae bacterium]MCB9331007.1 hypothetical protein [Lewinellaceae bacterium]